MFRAERDNVSERKNKQWHIDVDVGDDGVSRYRWVMCEVVGPEQAVQVRVEALKEKTFSGRVHDIAPRANRQGDISTFRTRVRVEGDTEALRPGMSAQAEI